MAIKYVIIIMMAFVIIGMISILHESHGKEPTDKTIDISAYYVGGTIKNVYQEKPRIYFSIKENVLKFRLLDNSYSIPYNKLLNYELKTETQIREKVTLGRLMLFGIFALGMKKQIEKDKLYGELDFLDENNKEQSIIFTLNNMFVQKILEEIHKAKNKYVLNGSRVTSI